ncbi:hypothetical protein FQN54_001501 [Arachnomyces sp. PD_36]|nr:hypothetical protein FQN54_001501 [Arachnomyces sp. PD_36]
MTTQGQPASLEKLPSLVTDSIIEHLDLDDVKSLRLCCKELSERCLNPHFKHFCRHQKTDLTEDSLKSLRALALHPTLGPAVKNLTIVTTVYDTSELESTISTGERTEVKSLGMIVTSSTKECTDEELRAAQSDLNWIKAQQKGEQSDAVITESLVSVMKDLERLGSITLDAAVLEGRGSIIPPTREKWQETWTRAHQVYRLAITAVARSSIAVDTLSVYRNTWRCSVPICHITAHTLSLDAADELSSTGRTIKNLAISVSPEIAEDFGGESLQGQSGYSIASLLKLMPNLETLDLHSYCPNTGEGIKNDEVLADVVQAAHLPLLKKCSWHGIYCTEQTMLQFLKTYPQIQHLTLEEIHLTEGTWEPIFQHLSSDMPALTSLHLSNLWGKRLVNLELVWGEPERENPRSHYYRCGGGYMVHTGEFDSTDIKRGLRFNPAPGGRAIGSSAVMNWRRKRESEYGAP